MQMIYRAVFIFVACEFTDELAGDLFVGEQRGVMITRLCVKRKDNRHHRLRDCEKTLSLRSRRKHKASGASPRRVRRDRLSRDIGRKLIDLLLSPVSRAQFFAKRTTSGLRPRLYAHACFAG